MKVRQVVLDTETTGLDPEEGHRIIEIGCVELINRRLTHNNYHQYVNPNRDIEEGALAVHGITKEFLQDKPLFVDVVRDFLAYVKDSELVIHNAEFDIGFLNYELAKIGDELGKIEDYCTVLDTLKLARQTHPGQRNDLDALCRRYEIDNTQRSLHGARLDAEILADVYLAITGGQTALLLDHTVGVSAGVESRANSHARKVRPSLPVLRADHAELREHDEWLKRLDKEGEKGCIWLNFHE